MDFLPTDSVSLLVKITAVESTHAPSIQFQLHGLLLSTLKFTFESQISRLQEKSPRAKITKFLDYLGEEKKVKKNQENTHIQQNKKIQNNFYAHTKKLHLIPVKTKAQQAKPGLTQCFFINPD